MTDLTGLQCQGSCCAARFVFRKHPDIVRLATSAYDRKQRAARRKRAAGETARETENSGANGGTASGPATVGDFLGAAMD